MRTNPKKPMPSIIKINIQHINKKRVNSLGAYIFCLKTKIKILNKNYQYGNFVYPYIVINASKLNEAYGLLKDYNQDEIIYINCTEVCSGNNNSNLYEKAIIYYLIYSITLNFIIYDQIIKETWNEIEKYPKLLEYSLDLSQGKKVDIELNEHAQMQAAMSKLFYGLESVEGSLNEINYKLNRLDVSIKKNHPEFSNTLQNLKIEQERLYNEFNIIENKVSTLLNLKNWQIETLTSILTQNNMNTIRISNDDQYKILSQSAAESAKGEVLEIALIWLAIMQVYGIFSDIIDNFFILSFGFDLIFAKILVAIIFLWLTFLLLKLGRIFVKKEYSKMKEEKRLIIEEEKG